MTRIGTSATSAAKRHGLAGGRDGKHRGAAAERRPALSDHAVAVAVRLDHRAHLRAALEQPGEVRDVPRDRAQVDAGDGALHGAKPRGSASITSLAITDSAAPTRSAAATPGVRVRPDARARGLERIEALREERADRAREDVAGAGGRERRRRDHADGDRPAGRGDDRVVALEDDDAVAALGRLARGREAVRADLVRVLLEKAPQLAGVRRDHGRLGARGEALERARVGVQAVGVEDERQVGAAGDLARDRERGVRAPEARAEDERRRLLACLQDLAGGSLGEGAVG